MDLGTVSSMRVARHRGDLALGSGERFLGGGTFLYSEPQPTTTGLVDLMGLGWTPLSRRGDGGLRIAATCTWAQLLAAEPELVGALSPLFRRAAQALLASFKIWNTGTVGGNMCLGFPAGSATIVACALDASCRIWSPDGGKRRVPARDFVTGMAQTVLAPGEVLRAIDIPASSLLARTALRSAATSPLGRAAAVTAGRRDASGAVTIVVAGASTAPYVFDFAEPPEAAELAERIDAIDTWFSDPHGSLAWRRMMSYRLAEEVRQELAA